MAIYIFEDMSSDDAANYQATGNQILFRDPTTAVTTTVMYTNAGVTTPAAVTITEADGTSKVFGTGVYGGKRLPGLHGRLHAVRRRHGR